MKGFSCCCSVAAQCVIDGALCECWRQEGQLRAREIKSSDPECWATSEVCHFWVAVWWSLWSLTSIVHWNIMEVYWAGHCKVVALFCKALCSLWWGLKGFLCHGFLLLKGPCTRSHLLAHLTGDVRLQAPCEDLVDDAVTVVGVVGFLPVVVCVDIKKTQSLKAMLCNFTAALSAYNLQRRTNTDRRELVLCVCQCIALYMFQSLIPTSSPPVTPTLR